MHDRRDQVEVGWTVLDRLLLKAGSGVEAGARSRNPASDSLARDLQVLLNTRREQELVPPEYEQCSTSVLNFGVPDLTRCGGLQSTAEQARVCRWLEEAIRMFEPRLRHVSVRLIDTEDRKALLRFRLEARAEFLSERLAFEMGLKRDTGEMSVIPS